jgi:deoxyribodipyrimidine photo-lyase
MMSPYLHFGQISPVYLALQVRDAQEGQGIDRAAYLEELIVRRELAINFVHYTPDYDRYSCLPDWARKTLAAHAGDRRRMSTAGKNWKPPKPTTHTGMRPCGR